MVDMITSLPELPKFWKVIPVKREDDQVTLLWDEAMPQNFDTFEVAQSAATSLYEMVSLEYVIMSIQQEFVGASFLFELVEPVLQ